MIATTTATHADRIRDTERLRDAVTRALYSDVDAQLSNLAVTVDGHGNLIVTGFTFRVIATFLPGTVTITRHATATGNLLGTVTVEGGVGPTPLAAMLQALAA